VHGFPDLSLLEHTLLVLNNSQVDSGFEHFGPYFNGLAQQGYRQIVAAIPVVKHAEGIIGCEVLLVLIEDTAQHLCREPGLACPP
jgi:hypothetical protein